MANEATVHRDETSALGVGLSSGGLCVVVSAVDGSRRTEVFLEPAVAETTARTIAACAAQARANMLAAVAGRLA